MNTRFSQLIMFALIIIVSIWVLKFMFKLLYFLAPIIVIYIAYKYFQIRKARQEIDKANQIFDAEYKDL